MWGYIFAVFVWAASLIAFKWVKGTPYAETLWGRVYKRQRLTVKAEIEKVSISQDGNGCIDMLIPSIKGVVSIYISQEKLDEVAKKIDIKAIETAESRTKVLLYLMQLQEKHYIAQIPEGNTFFLGNAVILKNKKKKDECGLSELEDVEEKIKSVLYNRNALLIVGGVLIFANPIISIVCSAIGIFLSIKNIPFASKDEEAFIDWYAVDLKNYPKAVSSQSSMDGRLLTKTEKTINEIKGAIGTRIPCPNCGVILTEEEWQYCPHCGSSLDVTSHEETVQSQEQHTEKEIEVDEGFAPSDEGLDEDLDANMDFPMDTELDGDMMGEFSDEESFMPDTSELNDEPSEESFEVSDSEDEDFAPASDDSEDDIELLDVDDLPSADDIEPLGTIIEGDFREVSNMAREFGKKNKKK